MASDATTSTDADCESVQGNNEVVRSIGPQCQLVKKPTADTLIMGAVQQLGKQAQELNAALKLAFERNQKLAASKTLKIEGNLSVSPVVDEPEVYELQSGTSNNKQTGPINKIAVTEGANNSGANGSKGGAPAQAKNTGTNPESKTTGDKKTEEKKPDPKKSTEKKEDQTKFEAKKDEKKSEPKPEDKPEEIKTQAAKIKENIEGKSL